MFIFCPVRDQLTKHYKDNLLRAKIKYVLFVYKELCGGMARGELRSTLSRAGPLPLPALTHQSPEIGKEKKQIFLFTRLSLYLHITVEKTVKCECLDAEKLNKLEIWINITKKTR